MQEQILVIEDDPSIGLALVQALSDAGYGAALAETAQQAVAAASQDSPAVILLDLGLPDMDGIELCRRLRARLADTRIIMVTARTAEIDVVVGLDAGADDYLTKPFRLAELLARVRAQLRRPQRAAGDTVTIGDLSLDSSARRVLVAGQEVQLTPKEFDLLDFLMWHAGEAVTRGSIMTQVWDEHWYGSTKTLDMHMSSLRRKIGDEDQSRIVTLRGVGYRVELE